MYSVTALMTPVRSPTSSYQLLIWG